MKIQFLNNKIVALVEKHFAEWKDKIDLVFFFSEIRNSIFLGR